MFILPGFIWLDLDSYLSVFFSLPQEIFRLKKKLKNWVKNEVKWVTFDFFSIFNNNKIKTSNVAETFVNQFDRLFMVVSDF